MKPSSAKAKGRRLQQKIRADILRTFPHLSEDDVRSTSMGASGEDILLSARAQEDVPFSIEAKNCERLNVWGAIEQCRSNCPPTRSTCIVFTRNHEATYAAIPWPVLLELLTRRPVGDGDDSTVQARLQTAIDAIAEVKQRIGSDS